METGVDIVKISRFEKYENDEKFLKKYFSSDEIKYILKKVKKVETMAGIFAAKEAVLKAFGIGIGYGMQLKEISINYTKSNKPFIEVDAKIQHYLNNLGCSSISISISHDGDYAVAFCVIN